MGTVGAYVDTVSGHAQVNTGGRGEFHPRLDKKAEVGPGKRRKNKGASCKRGVKDRKRREIERKMGKEKEEKGEDKRKKNTFILTMYDKNRF